MTDDQIANNDDAAHALDHVLLQLPRPQCACQRQVELAGEGLGPQRHAIQHFDLDTLRGLYCWANS